MWVCGFFSSVGNGLHSVPIQPGQKTGNGTQAVPYIKLKKQPPKKAATDL